ncbi:MAG TPA: ABC transporter ATP-binding protein, partial [Longimicrobiales bacterium]|nr:ABC transporter ATP-binding protein [Longimicrobiales bacterium]
MSWHVRIRLRLGALDLDVDMEGGEAPLALIGPNGSGKTTLLRTIAGAHRPDSGSIRLGSEHVFDSERGLDLPPERRHVGYVPQGYGLFPHLSVLDNVAFGWVSGHRRGSRRDRRDAAMRLLERMGAGHLAHRHPSRLSGGEQQRVALARALTVKPRILLLDKPLAALDARARRNIRSHLAEHLAERSGPAIVVSHDARDVAALGAHVHVIEDGRIVQRGSADALAEAPAPDFVAA